MTEDNILKAASDARREALKNAGSRFDRFRKSQEDASAKSAQIEENAEDPKQDPSWEVAGIGEVDIKNSQKVDADWSEIEGAGKGPEINKGGEENIVRENIPSAQEQIDPREKELNDALDSARKLYADIDFRDRSAMQQLKKFYRESLRGKNDDTETESIRSAKGVYEKALGDLKEYKLEKLKNGSADKEQTQKEIKDLLTYFNYTTACDLYNARTEAKMDYLRETENKGAIKRTWEKASLKMNQFANWYNKEVPLSVKFGLSAAAFVTTGSAFAAGKRIFGATMVATTGHMQTDALLRFMEKKMDNSDSKKKAKEVMGVEEDIDFERLSRILDQKIANVDKGLNRRVIASHLGKTVSVVGAAVLGYSAFNTLMDAIEHGNLADASGFMGKVMSLFHHNSEVATSATQAMGPQKVLSAKELGMEQKVIKSDDLKSFKSIYQNQSTAHAQVQVPGQTVINGNDLHSGSVSPIEQKVIHGNDLLKGSYKPIDMHQESAAAVAGATSTQEALHTPASPEQLHITSLEVKGKMEFGHFKSDSIWKQTKGLVEKMHPGASKAEINEYTRNIFDNSIKHYAQEHHISSAQALAKLSKIHEAKLDVSYDPNGIPHVDIHDVKFMHATHHGVGHHVGGGHAAHELKNVVPEKVEMPIAVEAINNPVEITNPGIADSLQGQIASEQIHLKAVDAAISQARAADNYEQLKDLATDRLKTTKLLEKLLGEDGSFKTGIRHALKLITADKGIVNKQEFWHNLKDVEFDKAMKDPNAGKAIKKLFENYAKVLGDGANPLKDKHETLGKWLGRVVLRSVEVKKEVVDFNATANDYKLAA